MASTTGSASGSTVGAKRVTTLPPGAIKNFSKPKSLLPRVRGGLGRLCDLLVQLGVGWSWGGAWLTSGRDS
jgi:hypothetical protein